MDWSLNKIKPLSNIKPLNPNYFELLPKEIQIEILSSSDQVLLISVRINKYFNELMSLFLINLPISEREIIRFLSNLCYGCGCRYCKSDNNYLIHYQSEFIIYDWNYLENNNIGVTIIVYNKGRCYLDLPYLFDKRLRYKPMNKRCFLRDERDEILNFDLENINNLDLLEFNRKAKYIIYSNRYQNTDKYNNIVKNKILKELKNIYQLFDLNNGIDATLFNEYITVCISRFNSEYYIGKFNHRWLIIEEIYDI